MDTSAPDWLLWLLAVLVEELLTLESVDVLDDDRLDSVESDDALLSVDVELLLSLDSVLVLDDETLETLLAVLVLD